ncbi:MAG TPA: hypothetical protein PK395_18810, partial [bacterium]|nr:hypothetical protein [bacterium]
AANAIGNELIFSNATTASPTPARTCPCLMVSSPFDHEVFAPIFLATSGAIITDMGGDFSRGVPGISSIAPDCGTLLERAYG